MMNMNLNILPRLCTISACVVLAMSQTACSILPKQDNRNKPTELTKLTTSQSVLQQVFKEDMSGGNKADPLSLQPVYDGQYVYLASRSGKLKVMTISGSKVWELDTKEQIMGGLTYDASTQTLIYSTKDGYVVARNGRTGTPIWKQQLTATVLAPVAISANNNRVLLSTNDGTFYGLSLETGRPIWKLPNSVPKISIRGIAQPVIDKNTVTFATADGRLHQLNIDNGQPIWSRNAGVASGTVDIERMNDIDATPIYDEDFLYSVSFSGQLLGANLKTKQVAFVKEVASIKQPVVFDNVIAVSTIDGKVAAFDKITGKNLWVNSDLMYRKLSNPVFLANHVVVGDMDGVLHVLDKSSGRIISREKTDGAIRTLQVAGYKLVVQTSSGEVSVWQ